MLFFLRCCQSLASLRVDPWQPFGTMRRWSILHLWATVTLLVSVGLIATSTLLVLIWHAESSQQSVGGSDGPTVGEPLLVTDVPLSSICVDCVADSDTALMPFVGRVSQTTLNETYSRCEFGQPCRQNTRRAGSFDNSHSLPIEGRLLIQGENSFGRYSNMRVSLLDFMQVSLLTGRTLVAAPMAHSREQCAESLEQLFDWDHLNTAVRVIAPPTGSRAVHHRLNSHCEGISDDGMSRRGRPMMLVNSERRAFVPGSTSVLPRWGQWKVAGGLTWNFSHYSNRQALPQLLRRHRGSQCVGIASGMWLLPFPRPHNGLLHDALRPSARIEARVSSFLSSAMGGSAEFVGVHLRLTDLYRANASHCARDMRYSLAALRVMTRARGIRRIALATDDPGSLCAQQLIRAFPATVLIVSSAFSPGSCSEAQFVQEVLARGRCFVGTLNSTFSGAVADLRAHSNRAYRRTPHPSASAGGAAGNAALATDGAGTADAPVDSCTFTIGAPRLRAPTRRLL